MPGIATPVGFYSIATVAESVKHLPGKYHLFGGGDYFPAMQLVYLGVDRRHQGREIGTSMAGAVVALFADVGQRLGIPHLILVPINNDVIRFYRDRLGFSCYKGTDRMYLPLQSAVDAMRAPPESETGDLFPTG
jgi:ribosomal protein S18 acetylase RimI-like enzyme